MNIKEPTRWSKNVICEENTCKHKAYGRCILINEPCPHTVCYTEDNNNNLPCDMVGYEPCSPKTIIQEKTIKKAEKGRIHT